MSPRRMHRKADRPCSPTVKLANPVYRSPLAEQYDTKIDALYDEIRRLRESRNADCSTTRSLPVEILSSVFQRLVASRRYRRSISWISVTHVCRKWRNIALDEPKLWTNTVGLPKQWLKLFLTRAKMVPLHVVYDEEGMAESEFMSSSDTSSDSSTSPALRVYRKTTKPIFQNLFRSPERIRKLRLVDIANEILDRLDQPAPYLTSLHIRGLVSITPKFLGNSAPQLQSFTLHDGSISLDMSWLRNLRKLDLACWKLTSVAGAVSNTVLPSARSFLRLLGTLERLEDLSVSFNHLKEAAPHKYSGPPVHQPNLQKAYFRFVPETFPLSHIFDHLRWPAIHNLDIKWFYDVFDEVQIDKVSAFFADNTAPLRRIIWYECSKNDEFRSHVGVSTSVGGPTLLFKRLGAGELPLQDLDTIEELEFRDDALLTCFLVDPMYTHSYPSFKRLIIHTSDSTSCKRRLLELGPFLKRRKSRNKGIEDLIICGTMWDIPKKDLAFLEKLVRVTLFPVQFDEFIPSDVELP